MNEELMSNPNFIEAATLVAEILMKYKNREESSDSSFCIIRHLVFSLHSIYNYISYCCTADKNGGGFLWTMLIFIPVYQLQCR